MRYLLLAALLACLFGTAQAAYEWNFDVASDYWTWNATVNALPLGGSAYVAPIAFNPADPDHVAYGSDDASVFARLNTRPLVKIGDVVGGGYKLTGLNNPPGTAYGSLYLSPTGGAGSSVLILVSPMSWTGSPDAPVCTFDLSTHADYRTRPPGGNWSAYDPARSGTFAQVVAMIEAGANANDYAAFWGPQIGMSGTSGTTFSVTQISLEVGNLLSLVPAVIYIQPGQSISIDMNVSNLQQKVNACQAVLGYSSTHFNDPTGGCVTTAGGSVWDQVIWDSWFDSTGAPGEIDAAIGVNASGTVGTDADGTVAKITLVAGPMPAAEGATKLFFRPNVSDVESTFLSDMNAQIVWPVKEDTPDIIIDGTKPVITCPLSFATSVATQSISASAADPVSGGVSSGVATLTMNSVPFTDPTTVVLVPGDNVFVFEAVDRAGNVATKTLTITYNQPAPTITIPKSVAPNAFGAASYPNWQANSRYAVLNGLASYGSGHEAFQAVTADPDYTVNLVSTFNSWLGIFGEAGEYGNRLTYVYRIDNGVQANPGAAELDLDNVSVQLRNYWTGSDSVADDLMDSMITYDWATRPSPAGFEAGNGRLKGYNWNGSAWAEVVGGRLADLIIFDNGMGFDNGSLPAGQDTLNYVYKQMSGAVVNTQYNPANTSRQILTEDEFQVDYDGHAGVGNASAIAYTTYESADVTKPVITVTVPANGSITGTPACTITGTATDNETLASGIREVKITLNGGQVYSNTAQDNVSFAQAVTLAEGPNSIVVTAKDFAGNVETKTVTVTLDTVDPVINIVSHPSPDPVLQGTYNIVVMVSDAAPSSGFAGPPAVEVTGGITPTAPVEGPTGTWTCSVTIDSGTSNGAHVITASVSDNAGNSATDTEDFVVNKNQITGSVELQGFVGASREVTFVLNGGAKTWTPTLSFIGGVASYTLTDAPDTVTSLSAKTAWNLRQRKDFGLGGNGQAVASFTGADKLLGGDLNGTNTVNILDYSILKTSWGSGPAGDINGDTFTGILDYSTMKSNWFAVGEAL